jgi:hypothetical protein
MRVKKNYHTTFGKKTLKVKTLTLTHILSYHVQCLIKSKFCLILLNQHFQTKKKMSESYEKKKIPLNIQKN